MQDENKSIYEWIANIIDSCNNDFHFEAVDKLISLYEARTGDADMVLKLQELKQAKWFSIANILH